MYFAICYGGAPRLAGGVAHAVESPESTKGSGGPPPPADSVDLSEAQLKYVKVEAAGEREFPIEKTAVGSIDFNEELLTQVFTQYPGRINGLFAKVGDEVKKGQLLFTIDSPDLLQASSTLISAAGVLQLTTKNLARLKRSVRHPGHLPEGAGAGDSSDHQTAEGRLARAARDGVVRIFGKTRSRGMLYGPHGRRAARRPDARGRVVRSPARITARNAAPGLFVQPGNPPAPFTVADISTMWMLANVTEGDSPAFKVGQEVSVQVLAFPNRVFEGHITTIASAVDTNTRRLLVRSEIADRRHELRAGMFATFVIRTGTPMRSVAIPLDGVVREGDGTMSVWVTADRRRFTKRPVRIGLVRDGYDQVLEGVEAGELVATEGAIFLSNALTIAAQ